jgi:hypothetical protein
VGWDGLEVGGGLGWVGWGASWKGLLDMGVGGGVMACIALGQAGPRIVIVENC